METIQKQPSGSDIEVSFTINGKKTKVNVERRAILLDTIRDQLELTGAKKGCGEGVCGSCSVLVNGEVICSCLMFTGEAEGADILTIEGLSSGEEMDPLQRAFIEFDGTQCGFCTAGQILSAKSFLNEFKKRGATKLEDSEIKVALEGNLCRCGCYNSIVQAVRQVAESIRKNG